MNVTTVASPTPALPAEAYPVREREVFVEQVDLLERNLRNGVASGALALPLVGYVLHGWPWPSLFWGWLSAILVMLGATLTWCWRWRNTAPRPANARHWGHAIVVLSGAVGVMWGMVPILFFQPQPEVAAVLLILTMTILVSGCTGGAPVLASAIAVMAPVAILFCIAALRVGGELPRLAALVAALMLGLLIYYAFNINRAIVNAIRMRLQNRDLSEALTEQRVHERTRVLEAASRHKSEFLASMSHELRTPLNAIIGYSEMLEEDAADQGAPSLVPDLQKITTSGRHLLELINSVLDLSKIEAGKLELHIEDVDLAGILAEVEATARPLAARNHNRIEVTCGPGVGLMRADATKLRQVLLNLVGNGCKFTEHGSVVLRVSSVPEGAGTWLDFSIEDSGIGMTPDQLARLFDEYMQADASTSKKYGGSGLGLALSRRLCRLMGGDITVVSEAGRGSTFTARLPSGVVAEPNAEEAFPLTGGKPGGTAGTVLVIDDEAGVRELLQRLLGKDGFRVLVAAGGEEGLRLAREHRPDVITLDVLMPGLDGWSVLGTLAADPVLSSIPVIMLTMVDERKTGYALGAADYLTKPVDRARLAAALGKFRRDLPVLVIEGEAAIRGQLARQLQDGGYAVTEAASGKDALRSLAERAHGAILLDLPMPGMDGFEFVAALAAQPAWRSIPVYIITAQELTPRQRALLSGSVVRILDKDGNGQRELLADVRNWIDASVGRQEVRSQ